MELRNSVADVQYSKPADACDSLKQEVNSSGFCSAEMVRRLANM